MRRPRRTLVLCILSSLSAACGSPAHDRGDPPPPADTPPPPAATAPVRVDLNAPVETLLRADWNAGRAEILVLATGRAVASLDELRAALPDLPERARLDPRYLPQLAHALTTLSDDTADCILSPRDIDAKLRPRLDPPDPFDHHEWDAQATISAPGVGDVDAPRWEGGALLVDCLRSSQPDFHTGTRHRFSLGVAAWTSSRDALPQRVHTPEGARAAVRAAFGGEVLGYVGVPAAGGGVVFLALSPAEGVRRYLWRPASGEPQRFATWDELRAAVDAFAAPEAAAKVIDAVQGALSRRRGAERLEVIADPDAYREDYRSNGRSTYKLRYHGDRVATTEYTVRDFDAIHAPKIEGERVVAYTADVQKQPYRLELDLSTLGWDSALTKTAMFEERIVDDTGDLFGGPRIGGPPLEPPRPKPAPERTPEPLRPPGVTPR
jgi:hypothetical protein